MHAALRSNKSKKTMYREKAKENVCVCLCLKERAEKKKDQRSFENVSCVRFPIPPYSLLPFFKVSLIPRSSSYSLSLYPPIRRHTPPLLTLFISCRSS